MKRFVFLAIAIFSIGSIADQMLLREFPAGSYIGEGWYLTSAGQEGRYSSFAEVVGTQWTAAYVSDGRLSTYSAAFDFSNDSFFNVDVTQVDSSGNQSEHLGNGYCIKDTCHLSAFLDHGLLEETVKFVGNGARIEAYRVAHLYGSKWRHANHNLGRKNGGVCRQCGQCR